MFTVHFGNGVNLDMDYIQVNAGRVRSIDGKGTVTQIMSKENVHHTLDWYIQELGTDDALNDVYVTNEDGEVIVDPERWDTFESISLQINNDGTNTLVIMLERIAKAM